MKNRPLIFKIEGAENGKENLYEKITLIVFYLLARDLFSFSALGSYSILVHKLLYWFHNLRNWFKEDRTRFKIWEIGPSSEL